MSDNYYRFFPGDYLRDTQGLTLTENGAYRMLLDSYYSQEFLPDDMQELFIICRAYQEFEQKAVEKIVTKYFSKNGNGHLLNRKAEEEIANRKIFLEEQARKAKLGGEATKQKWKEGKITRPDARPAGRPEEGPTLGPPSPSPSLKEKNNTLCPQQEIVDLWCEVFPEMSKPIDWGSDRQALLRARWNESFKGEDRKSLEWWRKFFLYIRDCPFLMGEIDPTPGHRRFRLTLEWILKRKNFRKIFEGDYSK